MEPLEENNLHLSTSVSSGLGILPAHSILINVFANYSQLASPYCRPWGRRLSRSSQDSSAQPPVYRGTVRGVFLEEASFVVWSLRVGISQVKGAGRLSQLEGRAREGWAGLGKRGWSSVMGRGHGAGRRGERAQSPRPGAVGCGEGMYVRARLWGRF